MSKAKKSKKAKAAKVEATLPVVLDQEPVTTPENTPQPTELAYVEATTETCIGSAVDPNAGDPAEGYSYPPVTGSSYANALNWPSPDAYASPTWAEKAGRFAKRAWRSFLGLFPTLVWRNDEVDVRVVFTANNIPEGVWQAGYALKEAGLTFDTGVGHDGRDWFLDYSLKGPMRVKFIGKTKNPVVRQE